MQLGKPEVKAKIGSNDKPQKSEKKTQADHPICS